MTDTAWVAIIGGGSLLGLFGLQAFRMLKGGMQFSKSFTRTYGLIFIATMAVFLVVTNSAGADLTAAFTVLGTIAGYLVGVQPDGQTKTVEVKPDGTRLTTVAEGGN